MTTPRVLIASFATENPYQRELIDALRAQGVEVFTSQGWWCLTEYLGNRANILHLHWLHDFFALRTILTAAVGCALFALQLAVVRFSGGRIVWTVHNLKMHEPRYPKLDRLATALTAKAANRLLVHCHWAKQEVLRRLPAVNAQHVIVTPHASYIGTYPNTSQRATARRSLGISERQTVFLFFGGVRPYKGVLELLDAFESVQMDDSVRLIIAGRPIDADFARAIQDRAKTLENVILVLGFIADHEIQRYMNAADAVVLPYREIFTSGAALLALSFGRAVVAPRIGCMGEVLTPEGSFLYQPDRAGALEEALARALREQDRLAPMGRHNYEQARLLSWTGMAKATATAYQQVMSTVP